MKAIYSGFWFVEEQQKVLTEAQQSKQKAEAKTEDLEDKLKNAAAIRAKELEAAQKAVDSAKKKMEDCTKKYKEKQQVNLIILKHYCFIIVYWECLPVVCANDYIIFWNPHEGGGGSCMRLFW